MRRSPGPRSCSTSRPATSRSARRKCAGCCARRNRRAASRPMPIRRPAPASRRPTSPGTARPASSNCSDLLAETERFSPRPRDGGCRCRSRPHPPGADAHQYLRRQRPRRGRQAHPIPHRRVRVCRARRASRAAPGGRALSVCAGRPGDAARELLRGLQHPGPGPRAAPAGDRVEKARHRRLGRARLDPGIDRLGAGHGPARECRAPMSSPTRSPALRRARRQKPMPGG